MLMAIVLPVSAAKITTTPVTFNLSAKKQTAILRVSNEGNTSSLIQIDSMSWIQEKGEDIYEPTEDILAVPALFELRPGEKQLVRIGLRKPPEPDNEHAYRIYLSEVPDQSVSEGAAIRVALRIGIPVFVLPNRPAAPVLEWRASCEKGQFYLKAINVGNANAKIFNLSLKKEGGKKEIEQLKSAGTLLAGTERSWEFGVSECPTEGSLIELLAQTNKGPLNAQIMVGR